jgi:hypothetical protein
MRCGALPVCSRRSAHRSPTARGRSAPRGAGVLRIDAGDADQFVQGRGHAHVGGFLAADEIPRAAPRCAIAPA